MAFELLPHPLGHQRGAGGASACGPRHPQLHPLLEHCDFVRAQGFVRRHLQIAGTPDGLDQKAARGVAGHHGRLAAGTAGQNRAPRIEAQVTFLSLGAMTFPTTVGQHRAHARFKEITF